MKEEVWCGNFRFENCPCLKKVTEMADKEFEGIRVSGSKVDFATFGSPTNDVCLFLSARISDLGLN